MERRCEKRQRSCLKCEWWGGDYTGMNRRLCYRLPVHVIRHKNDWCGEFEAKESLRERPLCECGHPKDRHGYGLHRCGVLGCRCGKFEAKKVCDGI